MTDIAYIHNVMPFPKEDTPPLYTNTPNYFNQAQWIQLAREKRKEMREGLQSGRYYPSDDFMAALTTLEQMLKEVTHV